MNQDPTSNETDQPDELQDDIHYFSVVDATWTGYAGVVLWGGFYGCLWAVIAFVIGSFYAAPQISFSDLITGIFGFILVFAVFGFVGMMAAGFMGILTTAVITLFNQSMSYIWSPVTACKISGGLAAFLSTCSISVVFLEEGNPEGTVISYLLGPTLAMFFGHIGASRMAAHQIKLHYLRQDAKVTRLWVPTPIENLTKFNIRQMLVLTGWFGVIFAIFSAIGRYSPSITMVLSSYFILQVLVYFLAEFIVRKYERESFANVTLPAET